MGSSYSYLNVWAVSSIVTATSDDIERVLKIYEKTYRDKQSIVVELPQDGAEPEPITVNYTIREDDFLKILHDEEFQESDIELLINLFRLIDNRGFREIDLRDVLISFTVLITTSIDHCFEFSMKLIEREGTNIIDKLQLVHIFKLLNAVFHYFGDKYLQMDQIQDLADSVYTSIGRIDGTIFYPHYIEYITSHPIIEMFLSPQYQGSIKDKLMSDEEIDAIMDKL